MVGVFHFEMPDWKAENLFAKAQCCRHWEVV